MRRDARAYLWDVLEASRSIHQFLSDRAPEAFTNDLLLRSAVERQLGIVSEALSQLAKVAPDIAQRIPELRRISAFRNVLIHGYALVDQDAVLRVIHENLPALQIAMQHQLDAMDDKGQ